VVSPQPRWLQASREGTEASKSGRPRHGGADDAAHDSSCGFELEGHRAWQTLGIYIYIYKVVYIYIYDGDGA